jgi:hypothetical protein
MANWINLFEKYRVDKRLLELRLCELSALSQSSPKRPPLEATIQQIQHDLHAAERILSHYGDDASSAQDALRRADERLFLAFHYIRGLTMEETAFEMSLSRDSIYRIRRRVLSRGDVPAEYIDEAGLNSLHSFQNNDFPLEPRINTLAACFAGAPQEAYAPLLSSRP